MEPGTRGKLQTSRAWNKQLTTLGSPSAGLDYADQRYYASTTGAFFSPDPSMDNVDYANPGSWNAYAYANGDPVNFNDPTGLDCASTPYSFNGVYQGHDWRHNREAVRRIHPGDSNVHRVGSRQRSRCG